MRLMEISAFLEFHHPSVTVCPEIVLELVVAGIGCAFPA
jgi:hypothetical protein